MMKLNWKTCIVFCISVFFLYLAITSWDGITAFLHKLIKAASTLTLGACIAYVVNILMSYFERKIAPKSTKPLWIKLRRPVCMLLAFTVIIAALFLLIQTIVPQLVECFNKLISALVDSAPRVYDWLDSHLSIDDFLKSDDSPFKVPEGEDDITHWTNLILGLMKKYSGPLADGVGGILGFAVTAASDILGFIVTAFLGLIFAVYILTGKEKLASQFDGLFLRIFGAKVMGTLRHILHVLNECFHAYIVGQMIEAVILGGLCALGMWLLRLPDPLMIGTLVGVTALIPVAGAYIGGGVGAIMIFATSPEPVQALIFIIFLLVLQQVEGNLIYPRTVGSTLHLPGIWVLAAVTIGGVVWQIPGMILFVPLTAAIYRLLGEWVRHGDHATSLLESIVAISKNDTPDVPAATQVDACSNAVQPVKTPASTNKSAVRNKANTRGKRR